MNKINLIGRLCKDVELRHTSNNIAVAKFTLAVDRKFVKQGEERKADFLNIVAFGKTAEFVSKYFTKGMRVGVSGRIENRSWEDSEGNKRYATEIIAEEVFFADGKKNEEVANIDDNNGYSDNTGYGVSDDLPF